MSHHQTYRSIPEARLGFQIVRAMRGDRLGKVMRRTCASCEAVYDQPMNTEGPPPPEKALRGPRNAGWIVDVRNHSATRCPACQAARKGRQAAQAPSLITVAPEPARTAQAKPQEHEAPMKIVPAANAVAPVAALPLSPIPGPTAQHASTQREPTYDERMRIRRILEECFDDKAGQWLEGLDDKKAGEKINVPWSLVTKIREAAYGPIRMDPELVAMREEILRLKTANIAMHEQIQALDRRMQARGA